MRRGGQRSHQCLSDTLNTHLEGAADRKSAGGKRTSPALSGRFARARDVATRSLEFRDLAGSARPESLQAFLVDGAGLAGRCTTRLSNVTSMEQLPSGVVDRITDGAGANREGVAPRNPAASSPGAAMLSAPSPGSTSADR